MIPNLQPNTTYAVHLRAASSSGGKDWVGSVTANNEIHTYWGRTGKIVQHAAKPGDISGLLKIINQKQNSKDRYTQVDEFQQQEGWQSQRKQSPSQPKAQTSIEPVVDWVEAPTDSINWDF
jgi:hypothetical protein